MKNLKGFSEIFDNTGSCVQKNGRGGDCYDNFPFLY